MPSLGLAILAFFRKGNEPLAKGLSEEGQCLNNERTPGRGEMFF